MVTIRSGLVGTVDPYAPDLPTELDTTLPTGWDGTADKTPGTAAQLIIDLADVGTGTRQSNGGTPYIIELTSGTDYVGQFIIPDGGGSDWLIIRTSQHSGTLPATGTRVTDATGMAKLSSAVTNAQIIRHSAGAKNVRFIGLEVSLEASGGANYGMIRVGIEFNDTTTSGAIIFDRCYIHADPTQCVNDGIYCWGGESIGVIDCRIADIVGYPGLGISESHGVWIHKFTGPSKIENCYIAASSENILTGGAQSGGDPLDLVQDLIVRGNHLFKDEAWRTALSDPGGVNDTKVPLLKNHFELKEGTRVLFEGNKCENCWPADGSQFGVSLVVKSDEGLTSHITIRNNFTVDTDVAMTITGLGGATNLLHVHDNVFNITSKAGTPNFGDYSRMIIFGTGDAPTTEAFGILRFENNTFYDAAAPSILSMFFANTLTNIGRLIAKNNIFGTSGSRFFSNGGAENIAALDLACAAYDFDTNMVVRGTPPTENATFANFVTVADFVAVDWTSDTPDETLANFVLTADSPGYTTGTDGTDIGADIAAITAALND